MKKAKILIWLCLPIMMSSCLTEGNYTVILPPNGNAVVVEATIKEEVIPVSMQQNLELYMPIYEGTTPPIVNGVYLFSPFESVYSSDGQYSDGYVIDDFKIMFSDQNSATQLLSYYGSYEDDNSYESSDKVSIIGSGNNFTAYFVATGVNAGISFKTATLISGTVSTTGIKNIYYAFVMLEKGDDPNYDLMDVNVYRVFYDSDGLAENSYWNKSKKINQQINPIFLKGSHNQKY